jgi:RNA polymerase sigma-32 factor
MTEEEKIEVSGEEEIISPEDVSSSEFLPAVEVIDDSLVPDSLVTGVQLGEVEPSESTDLARLDPLDQYLAEIKRHPPLSREEEHELAVKFKNFGDKDAGYKLIVSNLKLVVIIAREYQKNFQNILDLVQEGNIGLLEAVNQFDPYRGIRFPSYAAYWIRAYMLRYLINNIRLVKVGTTQAQRKLFFNLQKEKDRLESEGFTPEAKLLASRLGVKESEVLEMEQRLALPDLSVDAPIKGSDDQADYHSVMADDAPSLETQVADSQFSATLRAAVEEFKKGIPERERTIIDKRLFTEEPITLQEIADEFGLSRERIRQVESRLKDELKSFLKVKLQLGDEGEILVGGE